MKICLINNLYSPYNRGGAEKVVSAMIAQFQSQDNEVFLITTKPKKPSLGETSDCRTVYLKNDFYNIGRRPLVWRFFWHIGNVFSIFTYFKFKKIFKHEKPDLVITHNLMGIGFMAARAIKKSGAKHHHFLHDIQLLHPSGLMMWGEEKIIASLPAKIYQTLTRFFLGSPDLIISPSHWLLEEHISRNFFPSSPTEIQTLAEIFEFKSWAGKGDNVWHRGKKNLLFVGQTEKHKGIVFLIEAFKKYANSEMTLTIAGDGSLLAELQSLHNNEERIKFLGKLKQEELAVEMKKADVLIVPSLCYENSPTVILEAQTFSLPVIASKLGGIPEIVNPHDRLFTPGQAEELFREINN